MKTSLLYIATADIGIPLFKALASDERFEMKGLLTAPDRPAGRGMKLKPPAIKEVAEDYSLPVFQPTSINSPESLGEIKAFDVDLIVLFAYGQILSQSILDLPKHGCINMHASLLPHHRGASPIQQSLLAGDTETGISVMKMVEKMDAGPVFAQFKLPVNDTDDAITLHQKLSELAASEPLSALHKIAEGTAISSPQNEADATYCQKIQKTDGQIDWSQSAEAIARKCRAYAGWPGCFTFFKGKRLKVLKAQALPHLQNDVGLVSFAEDSIVVGCAEGSLELLIVQPEGKKPQSIDAFNRGHSDFRGALLV